MNTSIMSFHSDLEDKLNKAYKGGAQGKYGYDSIVQESKKKESFDRENAKLDRKS